MASFTASDSAVGVSVVSRIISAADAAVGTAVVGRGVSVADTASGDDLYRHPPVLSPPTLSQHGTGLDVGYLNVIATEAGTGHDAAFMINPSFVTADTGTGVDAVSDRTIFITEAGAGVDAFGEMDHVVADDGLAMDVATIGYYAIETATGVDVALTGYERWQLGVGTDAASLAVSFTVADAASGLDASVPGPASFTTTDSGAGVASLSLSSQLAAGDSGTVTDNAFPDTSVQEYWAGVDAGAQAAAVTGADAASGTETALTAAMLPPVSDAGDGVDAGVATSATVAADAGDGVDVGVPGYGLADYATGSDFLTGSIEHDGSDAASGADEAVVECLLPPVNDSASGLDSAATSAVVTVSEAGFGSEVPEPSFGYSDYAVGVDTSVVTLVLADYGSFTDSATAPTAADYGTGDDVAITTLHLSDFGTGVDALISITVLGLDAGTGVEFACMGVPVDFGVGVDDSVLDPSGGDIDYAWGSDAAALDVGLEDAASDFGTLSDSADVTVALALVSDHGTGSDIASYGILATCSDSGTGTDAGMPVATPLVYPEEQGAFIDVADTVAEIFGSDSGSGEDTAGYLPPGAMVVPRQEKDSKLDLSLVLHG